MRHIVGPTGLSLCGASGRQADPASATCEQCKAAYARQSEARWTDDRYRRAPGGVSRTPRNAVHPGVMLMHIMPPAGSGQALCGGDSRAWALPADATCTACQQIHDRQGRSPKLQVAPRLEDPVMRQQIIDLALAAWRHGVNPWADSYRPNWHEIMIREAPCEALVLALRPDVVLRLLGVDPYKP